MALVSMLIKYGRDCLSSIGEGRGIRNLCEKFSPNDSEKYLTTFNYSKFQNKAKE
jgi:hypothetical protein